MTFSSEIEKFKRATHQTPVFVGILKVKIQISSEIEVLKRKLEIFKRKLETFKRPSKIAFFFSRFGPSGSSC